MGEHDAAGLVVVKPLFNHKTTGGVLRGAAARVAAASRNFWNNNNDCATVPASATPPSTRPSAATATTLADSVVMPQEAREMEPSPCVMVPFSTSIPTQEERAAMRGMNKQNRSTARRLLFQKNT